MRFAVALPWWGYLLAFGLAVALAWLAYVRVNAPISARQRALLVTLRAMTLVLVVAALLRPVAILPADQAARRLVPVLVDVSRSMGVADADGDETRLAAASRAAQRATRISRSPCRCWWR